jgi:hypothetical protein
MENRRFQVVWKVYQSHKIRKEPVDCDFEGTIVDIETIGPFVNVPSHALKFGQDFIRRYQKMKVTTVGTLSDGVLQVAIALGQNHLDKFGKKVLSIVSRSDRPLYAFSKPFEEGCLYWISRSMFDFDNELQAFSMENKERAVQQLKIPSYNDPYRGVGFKCVDAFIKGDLENIAKHNRACLLKERDLLGIRGARRMQTKWLDIDKLGQSS